MTHLNEEQLILHFYGDAGDHAEIEQHLADCAECRASFEALKQTLAVVDATPVPERGAGYGRAVWARIEPRLDEGKRWNWLEWLQPRRLAFAGAAAALLIAAFWFGRITQQPVQQALQPATPEVRERILLVAVGEHLERSQMVLVELVNTKPNGTLNIAPERERAENLMTANRLYRQTAMRVGDAAVANVLDELERVLLEIARSPSAISSAELVALQRRIESRGILFKVRVVGSQVREREREPLVRPAGGRS